MRCWQTFRPTRELYGTVKTDFELSMVAGAKTRFLSTILFFRRGTPHSLL